MKRLALAIAILTLTGCTHYAQFVNSQDPCQSQGKKENWTRPDWCWRGNATTVNIQRVGPGAFQVYTTR